MDELIENEIKATKTDKSQMSTHLKIVKESRLGSGYEGVVNRVNAEVSTGGKSRHTMLAYKEVSRFVNNSYEETLQGYQRAKDAGLPVPTTFRSTEDKKSFIVSDLTQGGKNIIISINTIRPDQVEELFSERADQMSKFETGIPFTSKDVEEKCKMYSQKAAEAGLDIPKDAWFVVIKPDGDYQLILGDFGAITGKPYDSSVNLEDNNYKKLAGFTELMGFIQKYRIDPEAKKTLVKIDDQRQWDGL